MSIPGSPKEIDAEKRPCFTKYYQKLNFLIPGIDIRKPNRLVTPESYPVPCRKGVKI